MFSNDEGAISSSPEELPGSLSRDRHMARYDEDGRILMVFRDTCICSRTAADFVGWVGRYPTEVFKYLWYWRNYAGGMGYPWYGRSFNAGLEPCTSLGNGGVTQSQDNGTARRFRGNESIKVTLFAGGFTGSSAVTGMDGNRVLTG